MSHVPYPQFPISKFPRTYSSGVSTWVASYRMYCTLPAFLDPGQTCVLLERVHLPLLGRVGVLAAVASILGPDPATAIAMSVAVRTASGDHRASVPNQLHFPLCSVTAGRIRGQSETGLVTGATRESSGLPFTPSIAARMNLYTTIACGRYHGT